MTNTNGTPDRLDTANNNTAPYPCCEHCVGDVCGGETNNHRLPCPDCADANTPKETIFPNPASVESVFVFENGTMFATFFPMVDYATLTLAVHPTTDSNNRIDFGSPATTRVTFPVASVEIARRIVETIRASGAVLPPF